MMSLSRISKSIVTRLMIFGIGIVLAGTAVRYHLLTDFLREDLEKVVGAQLEALAGYVARDVDNKIVERQKMLKRLAATFPFERLKQPEALRAWLGERHELQPLFSLGLFVTDLDGAVLVDYPRLAGRTGTNLADRDYIQAALAGKSAIGSPVLGRVSGQPVLPIAEPIKDASGKVRAILAGISALAAPGFLDLLQERHIGTSGGFLLIAPREQIFVAATKPELIFRATAAPGVNPLHDRALAGWRGSGVTVNAQGVEEVAAVASVPSTDWFVVARLPTAEAFASVGRVQQFVLRNISLAIVALVILLGLVMIFVFRPLFRAADYADRMTREEMPLAPLPVAHDDEVGHLTNAFNRLLAKLLTSQAELAHMAHHDPLTGLPNRLLLADRMGQALARSRRNGACIALLFLDLDGFKPINDSLGHEAGDDALVQVARRLAGIVRQADTLARVGGDEFVVVMGDLDPSAAQAATAARNVAAKCIEAVRMPMTLNGAQHSVGLSIGIAIGNGASSFDALMVAADTAMYEAKQSGRGRHVLASLPETQAACAAP
jgi:diguanylate cyclase (GGDEF)-like protein